MIHGQCWPGAVTPVPHHQASSPPTECDLVLLHFKSWPLKVQTSSIWFIYHHWIPFLVYQGTSSLVGYRHSIDLEHPLKVWYFPGRLRLSFRL